MIKQFWTYPDTHETTNLLFIFSHSIRALPILKMQLGLFCASSRKSS